MPALYPHTTRSTGTVLTAAIYNADHENHITNGIPSQLDDYSSDVTQMRSTVSPGTVGAESLPTSLAGELERIRHVLKTVHGGAQWYPGSLVFTTSIIDAKGDLIVGTANDTPARKAVGSNGALLMANSTITDGLEWVTAALSGHIQGLVPSRNSGDAARDTDISAGVCMDATGAQFMRLASVLTKQLDVGWAVGTNSGGLDTGAIASNTWYAVWLIKRSDTGVVDALFSTSFTAPIMPTNYDFKRLVGAVKTDGSSNVLAYTALETAGGGLQFIWADPPLDVDVVEDATANTRALGGLPAFAKLTAYLNVTGTNSGAPVGLYISSLDANTEATSTTFAPLASVGSTADSGVGLVIQGMVRVVTDTSAQIRTVALNASTNLRIATIGWEWSRRV